MINSCYSPATLIHLIIDLNNLGLHIKLKLEMFNSTQKIIEGDSTRNQKIFWNNCYKAVLVRLLGSWKGPQNGVKACSP